MSQPRSLTYELLSVVGSPFARKKEVRFNGCSNELCEYARKNRMILLYLDSLEDPCFLYEKREQLRTRSRTVGQALIKVAEVLRKTNVEYAFFKTIRPYKEVTVDLDILIMDSGYLRAVKALTQADYAFLEGDNLSCTFRDVAAELNIDLYDNVSASRIIYLDKAALRDFVTEKQMDKGVIIKCLSKPAELLTVISHSVIKEQMYVLSEYYTSIYFLSQMDNSDIKQLLDLAKACRLHATVSTHISITAYTHNFVHGFVPSKISEIVNKIGVNSKDLSQMNSTGFKAPYKYNPLTFACALFEKLGENTARRSFASQTRYMLNPHSGMTTLSRVFLHIDRESY